MLIQTLFLSIVQSITEFLPVSSSGHLILTRLVMGWEEQGAAMDIALHVGTLLAVCVYFFKDLWRMLIDLFKGGAGRRMIYLLLVATFPVLLVGFFYGRYIEMVFRNPYIVCVMLIVFGVILWLADKYSASDNQVKKMTVVDAFSIGIAQCLAFVPGVSRSGITMTMARFRKINRSDAAYFTMLLSIPVIAAAGCWVFLSLLIHDQLNVLGAAFVEGIIFSFVGGLAVIWFLMNFVKKHSFFAFMVYRIILAIIVLIFLFFK